MALVAIQFTIILSMHILKIVSDAMTCFYPCTSQEHANHGHCLLAEADSKYGE